MMMISVTFFCFEVQFLKYLTHDLFLLFAAANKGKGAIFLLLDLRTAIDPVDHGILIDHLKILVSI